jgi:hypothetical protein
MEDEQALQGLGAVDCVSTSKPPEPTNKYNTRTKYIESDRMERQLVRNATQHS